MKVLGSVALGSSSARKYLRTCESCFQKLRVSCRDIACQIVMCFGRMCRGSPMRAYLEFGMAFVDEDVGGLELGDVAVALELLPHLGADGRDGHVQGVHGLDLGCLESCASRQPSSPVFHYDRHIAFSSSFFFPSLMSGVGAFVPHAASPGMS